MRKNIEVVNINFTNLGLKELMVKLDISLQNHVKLKLAFSNPEFLIESLENKNLESYLNAVDFNLADGAGIIMASKILNKNPLEERVTGTDFVPALMQLSRKKGYTTFFLGGKPSVAGRAKTNLEKLFPDTKIIGTNDGYFQKEEEDLIIEKINKLSPDFLMVCLGNPKQEEWIERNYEKINAKVIFGNGGALDFWSSEVRRAPKWMQNNNLEWLFRLFQDLNKNRIKRQAKLLKFPFIVFRQFAKQGFRRI